MKKIIIYLLLSICTATGFAQELRTVCLPLSSTIHFLSPEPIRYVDISSKDIIGDLPIKNVLRIRYRDSIKINAPATVTVVGERFIAQYKILPGETGQSQIDIQPEDQRPLDISGVGFSQPELRAMAMRLFSRAPDKKVVSAKAFNMKARVNHIYTAGDHIFLDLSFENNTDLRYSIDGLRFSIEDKKVTKAANNQSVEIRPELTLFDIPQFSKRYRNVFVFRKVSFPGNKRLQIELSEMPISGRVLTVNIAYRDILDADVISF
jgi:conjugative transposon TraN protein